MNPTKLFPLIITEDLAATRAYYTDKAGFTVTMEQDQYLQVRYGSDEAGPELAFWTRSDDNPMGCQHAFGGRGLVISIPTDNADEKFDALRKRGATTMSEPSDKPWGWRSFAATDPNGVILDFFHVTAQSAVADATG
ncbi:MAG: VOC family protein [Deltaproteobacteria bacterium]|nr:VOC family protein [Deltaproteobacteria bacterium]